MNQSDFLLCLSRMTMTDNDQEYLLYKHLNSSSNGDGNGGGRCLQLFGSRHDDHEDHAHDHDDQSDESDTHGVVMAKATAMLVLFCATTICGAIPFLLNRYFKGKTNNANPRSATVVKCLLYFGGGVLLCTTFLHLLPEVRETVESLQECGTFPSMNFPFVELLMCSGFFFMFLIEELIHTYIHRNKDILTEETAAFERGHSIRHSHIMRNADKSQGDYNDTQMTTTSSNYPSKNGSVGGGSIKTLSKRDLYLSDTENQKHQHNDHQRTMHQVVCPTAPSPSQVTQENAKNHPRSSHHSNHSHHHHSHSHYHQHHSHLPLKDSNGSDDVIASSLRGLLIVLALSVHELFEGLAIGLEGSASNVWFMFAAVSAHKLVLAFCVGVELIVAGTRPYLSILFIFTFAIVSPIGIGIGMLVSNHNATASSIPSAILQGLACGTLLYVVFFEILSKDRSGLLAYLALLVGFGMMFGLQQLFAGHGHQHSHGGCSHSEEPHSHSHALENQPDNHRHLTAKDDAQRRSLEKIFQILPELKNILNKN